MTQKQTNTDSRERTQMTLYDDLVKLDPQHIKTQHERALAHVLLYGDQTNLAHFHWLLSQQQWDALKERTAYAYAMSPVEAREIREWYSFYYTQVLLKQLQMQWPRKKHFLDEKEPK